MSRYHNKLNTYSWWLHEQKCDELNASWILDIRNKKRSQEVASSVQQDACWNSDVDDGSTIDASDDEEKGSWWYVEFQGFHPYKEVIFLCHGGSAAMACCLNSSKVQYLGDINLGGGTYNRGEREAFVYTPCLIGDA